jgi:hypothetical protein
MIIKALVIPIFTFVACVVPDKYRKEIESKCFKFLWNGRPDKVKRNTMIGNFEMGGLNMHATKVNIGMTNALIIIGILDKA